LRNPLLINNNYDTLHKGIDTDSNLRIFVF